MAILGWVVLAYVVLLWAFAGEETNCTAHRGEAYQDCVRSSDLTGLWVQGLVMGLAMVAIVTVSTVVARQKRSSPRRNAALIASASLVLASVAGWILGARSLWAPDRPFPYEPVATSQGHAILLTGGFVGLLIGALTALAMTLVSRKSSAA